MLLTLTIDDELHLQKPADKLVQLHYGQVSSTKPASGVATDVIVNDELLHQRVLSDTELSDGIGFDLRINLQNSHLQDVFVGQNELNTSLTRLFCTGNNHQNQIIPDFLIEALNTSDLLIRDHLLMHIKNLVENRKPTKAWHNKLIVKTRGNSHIIEVNKIISWESDITYPQVAISTYVKIHVSKTHGEHENMLTDSGFYWIHKPCLINLLQIRRFDSNDGRHIIRANSLGSPAAYREYDELFLFFEKPVE